MPPTNLLIIMSDEHSCKCLAARGALFTDAYTTSPKARQAEMLAKNGGREAAIARGDLGFSPVPWEPADFRQRRVAVRDDPAVAQDGRSRCAAGPLEALVVRATLGRRWA